MHFRALASRFLATLLLAFVSLSFARAAENVPRLKAEEIELLRTTLTDAQEVLSFHYLVAAKVGKEFAARCAATGQRLASAESLGDGYSLIEDVLSSADPRIRLYPPFRSARIDYGWSWSLVGNAAYVTQIDHEGDVVKQGLKLGDRILSFEGSKLDRTSYLQIYYVFRGLAPRAGLRIQVQSPGEAPRWLGIAATIRPPRQYYPLKQGGDRELRPILTPHEIQHDKEFRDIKQHVRKVGNVLVWKVTELLRNLDSIDDGLKETRGCDAVVLDLRGLYVRRTETILRLLDGLFTDSFDIGTIRREHDSERLRVHGSSSAFKGQVFVLVDAETAQFAEVMARVIQQHDRGVIIGDRTMGRVVEESIFRHARGAIYSFNISGVLVPTGELTLADNSKLDGVGTTPDLLLLPKAEDIAQRRDIVLSKAVAMAKQKLSPEDAFKLFWIDYDDDETY